MFVFFKIIYDFSLLLAIVYSLLSDTDYQVDNLTKQIHSLGYINVGNQRRLATFGVSLLTQNKFA